MNNSSITTADRAVPELPAMEAEILRDSERKRARNRVNVWTIRLGALVAVLGSWQVLSSSGVVDSFFVSSPLAIAERLAEMLMEESTWTNIQATAFAALLALAIGSAAGIGCGLLFTRIPVVAKAMNPYITFLNSLPRPALAPIAILWFGLGMSSKVVVGVSIVFFILLLNTMAGLRNVDSDIATLTQSLGASNMQRFTKVELPTALPSIVAGLRLGATYSVLGVVVSEIVAAYDGLGTMLVAATNAVDLTTSFAVLTMMATIAVVLDMIVRILEKRVAEKHS